MLRSGQSCKVEISFTPDGIGERKAELVFTTGTAGEVTVALAGVGTVP